jgi:hypothetical protein
LAIVSSFIARLPVLGGGWLACIVPGRHFCPRPLGEEREETGDILGDLPGVLAGQITC